MINIFLEFLFKTSSRHSESCSIYRQIYFCSVCFLHCLFLFFFYKLKIFCISVILSCFSVFLSIIFFHLPLVFRKTKQETNSFFFPFYTFQCFKNFKKEAFQMLFVLKPPLDNVINSLCNFLYASKISMSILEIKFQL